MTEPHLTAAARSHVNSMTRAIRPHADRLERAFRKVLRTRGYPRAAIRAFLAITPAAAARLRTAAQFLEQVAYHGRRLAKLNVEPGEVQEVLREFGELLDGVLGRQFQPAREQLHLAATFVLRDAFYEVREEETRAFFGLERAEARASGLEDLLRRFVAILTQTFRARSGRLLLLSQPIRGKLARPLYVQRGKPEERLIADPWMRGRYASYWSFPLRPGYPALLQFGFAAPYPWLPRELTLLNAVAERCREAIEKARLREENSRLEAQARCAEADERQRIGRELHDEAGQALLALRLQLELLEREAGANMRPRLAEARRIAEGAVEDIRRLVAALSPAMLERLGLEAALRQLAARFQKMHPAAIRLRLSGCWDGLPRQAREAIYRVAQESLQNIAKHSQATHVNLLLQRADRRIRLSVHDNGAGFCVETVSGKAMTFGLAGMRQRAALLGGQLTIGSSPGKGTTVALNLPATGAQHGKDSNTSN
jgi:signal transduction histidine kinase